jgi:hypothetical protein
MAADVLLEKVVGELGGVVVELEVVHPSRRFAGVEV